MENKNDLNGIAIIGMAGQFPHANNIYVFWDNLINAKECITYFNDEDLLHSGIDPEILKNPNYVKAKGTLENIDLFDAPFFGINPREAELTDPQHRLLLECAWESLENAGYACFKYNGSIGVYAGCGMNSYMLLNVYPQIKKEVSAGTLIAAIGNDKDSLATTISYRMNLKGPAITVQTSSSTSLVAVCVACQSLLTYQCDMAIAGGVALGPPLKSGYLYEENGIMSPDGHCRAFDASSKGFVPGMGMGLVVLKRLSEAIKDRDHIWAVIKGFAVNNDGSKKVSYSAPSVDRQAEVVMEAQAIADFHPDTISYIETHGTGTQIGDPIEVTALTQAFRTGTDKKQFCAIGSVKTNIGHLDTAAGIAGLIKASMIVKNKIIPPSLNFSTPNPKANFEDSPFYVNTILKEWNTDGIPRRAGVTSLGMGGTNAHVVLEEMEDNNKATRHNRQQKSCYLLPLSTKTSVALENYTDNLIKYLKTNTETEIKDVAYTLAVGRNEFAYKQVIICKNKNDLINASGLNTENMIRALSGTSKKVAFMFSGQGSQYINMGKEIYEQEKVFRDTFDMCVAIFKKYSNSDIKNIIYTDDHSGKPEDILKQTQFAQPALFIFEYSLATLLMSWGINPSYMIGHSLGEYVAACLSDVISLEDAIKTIYHRSNLMQAMEKGSMLAVGCNKTDAYELISGQQYSDLSIAAINSPDSCVISGKTSIVKKLMDELLQQNIYCRLLDTSHAFHSKMMEPMLDDFIVAIKHVKFSTPKIPFVSCISGEMITDKDAMDFNYWVKQVMSPVCFSEGVNELLKEENVILLEIGPRLLKDIFMKKRKTLY